MSWIISGGKITEVVDDIPVDYESPRKSKEYITRDYAEAVMPTNFSETRDIKKE